jgi:hypothetical protein
MGYRILDKQNRNERIFKFWQAHPKMTYKAIGRVFHISESRAWRIILQEHKKATGGDGNEKLPKTSNTVGG